MEQNCNNIVDIHYQQTGEASATNELGMREMQAKAYEEGLKRVVVAVPEKSIGRSFQNTRLMPYGFFADWATPTMQLCSAWKRG